VRRAGGSHARTCIPIRALSVSNVAQITHPPRPLDEQCRTLPFQRGSALLHPAQGEQLRPHAVLLETPPIVVDVDQLAADVVGVFRGEEHRQLGLLFGGHAASDADLFGVLDLVNSIRLPSCRADDEARQCRGTWSLSVTRNRRLTFRNDVAENEICDVNLEDYH